ncbi:MAG: exonuclease SbcCD subunit D C-terminal domain-containing protein [gamma proteobacterium symbiont of Lucinoma myriamae]|nr:exonuclease SbcCD subunit D C-terminal domain-containing protein [gamma proteobacterium symbiont of Lucinoma myriamae]MCU7818033.1 exonuclease SbcCD subunit D C-terminal domain-containing protein [gamma proteobacterium symbiont of Lucinoma myriamae]MCU7831689.1 exonuclease SbcCD subunit D C-terminal domain-containing protein [gamma proteobacterium symbiont of Lucinoma myriamae]
MIKIIHTADWHLGHRLHGISRSYEHDCFLSWLIEQIKLIEADVLLIAGDIFDSANPPADAQSMFYNFLIKAKQCSPLLDIVIIGGNHDSASRLDAPSQILDSLGIKVIGGLTHQDTSLKNTSLEKRLIDWSCLVVPLTDKDGVVRAICGAMPFIRNADINNEENISDDNDPLIAGVEHLYQQLYAHMQDYKKEKNLSDSIGQIVTGHCYMVGAELSELSERRILGGNQHALPAQLFNEAIDYVALGHLHKAQKVSTNNNTLIHYSGSPIPLSFTERNYQHQIIKICLPDSEGKQITAEKIKIPRAVTIQSIPDKTYAKLSDIGPLIEEQGFDLRDDKDKFKEPMLEIKIELDKPEPALRQQIENLLEDKAARLLKLSIHYPGKGEALAEKKQTRLEELHPEDVFQQCYQRMFEQQVPDKISSLFHELLESVEETE